MTTQDIIQILPFEEEFKTKLLADFDTLTPDQKFTIEQYIWDTYNAIYKIRLEANVEEALAKVADKQETIDKDFYKRIEDRTKLEMDKQQATVETKVDLSSTREELQKILDQTPQR